VVTRGLALLLTNLLASMIIAAACCLRQIAADTPPDSPLAFQIPCGYMEVRSNLGHLREKGFRSIYIYIYIYI
jgi:hypothetical protein